MPDTTISWTREYQARKAREWYRRIKQDPERLAAYRKRHSAWAKAHPPKHPQKYPEHYYREHYLEVRGKVIRVIKRPYPDNSLCELCKKQRTLGYHHWDDDHPERGMWVCISCHHKAEGLERGWSVSYLALKESIEQLY